MSPDSFPVTVDGFGVPFANRNDPELEGWVNENKPMVDGITLLDVLRQESFYFVIAQPLAEAQKDWDHATLPPPFSYPYGTRHEWDMPRYERLLAETKAPSQFPPAYSYEHPWPPIRIDDG